MDKPFTTDPPPTGQPIASHTLRSGRSVEEFADGRLRVWGEGQSVVLTLAEAAALGMLANSRPGYKAMREGIAHARGRG